MDPFSIYGGSYMISSRVNLAKSASGNCVNHVYVCGVDSFSLGIVYPPYKLAVCVIGD